MTHHPSGAADAHSLAPLRGPRRRHDASTRLVAASVGESFDLLTNAATGRPRTSALNQIYYLYKHSLRGSNAWRSNVARFMRQYSTG